MDGKGRSNLEIKKVIANSSNDDLKVNFAGVFASNEINYLISFHSLIKNKDAKYIFLISNTDRADRPGTHWWSIVGISSEKRDIFV